MDYGLHICTFDWGDPTATATTLAQTARDAEAAGFSYVTMMDHFIQAEGFMPPHDPIIEGYTGLSFVAAHTERVKLGMLVTGVLFRNPGVLAKTTTTLDVLSGGRAFLGLGGAWYEREHRALGIDYPGPGERLGRLEETIQICQKTWSDDDSGFSGEYYTLAETMCSPRPLTDPHPPVMVGGGGEKRTLQIVARHADMWNIGSYAVEVLEHKLDVLRAHCDAADRDFDSIRRTVLWMSDAEEDPDAFRTARDAYEELGFEALFVMPYGGDPRRATATIAELTGLASG